MAATPRWSIATNLVTGLLRKYYVRLEVGDAQLEEVKAGVNARCGRVMVRHKQRTRAYAYEYCATASSELTTTEAKEDAVSAFLPELSV